VGENVKTCILAVAAAGLLFLTACSAPMPTADSCKEFNALGASIADPGSMTKDARAKVAGKFADLAAKSSDALKDDVKTTAEYIKAAVADSDAGNLARLQAEFDSAAKRIQAVCNTVH
jgi:hypothetical protein